MSRRIILSFDHMPCGDITVDIYLPYVESDVGEGGVEELAKRHRPACPICKQPARYVGFGFENAARELP